MHFDLENHSSIKVAALVDGKVIECLPGKVAEINGEKVELYLPDYKIKKEAPDWSDYTYKSHGLQLYEMEYSLYEGSFPLDPGANGVAKVYASFRFTSVDGKMKKVVVWTDDGHYILRAIRYEIPKFDKMPTKKT